MYRLSTKNGYEISQVISKHSNVWLVQKNQLSVLVDSGKTKSRTQLMHGLNTALHQQNDLQYLMLTHTHYDHCQSAKALKDLYHCKVITSEKAVPSIAAGYTHLPRGTNYVSDILAKAGHALMRKKFMYAPFNADITISDDYLFPAPDADLRIITTPGHSADSISLIVDNEVAIVGDAMFGIFRNHVFPPFADDIPEMIRSWGKLLNTGCTTFLPGHGRAISRELLEKEFRIFSKTI
jgi:glyoxylase-like metal-dependent hydrolase (beta-lactamase superfamily II)